MRDLRQRSIILSVSFLLALVGVLAADYRLRNENSVDANRWNSDDPNEDGRTQSHTPVRNTAQTIGQIDPPTIAGGGGTSTGGSFRLDGTLGEVSASSTLTGGTFTINGGFWSGLSAPTSSTPTPTPTPNPSPTPTPPPNVMQFSASNYNVQEDCTLVTITVNRIGDTSAAASVDYNTSDITATERKDYITALGRLRFAAGQTSRSFDLLVNEDSFVEGNESFNVNLTNPIGATLGSPVIATVNVIDDSAESQNNVNDDPQSYVCQQYHDFLNRQPDAPGLAFWTNEITSCGANAQCIDIKRINVSAAFFLSIEFQQTGYLIERLYKTAYGDATGSSSFGGIHPLAVPIVRFREFLLDTQQIGQGVIVGQGNWEQILEDNKQMFTAEFVQRSRFTLAYPTSLMPTQFMNLLFINAGVMPSDSDRNAVIAEFGGALNTSDALARARALRRVAEHTALTQQEFNRAFVLMQYLGYLRRNPNDPPDTDYTGFDFWLNKLTQFNGNFIEAEMVKAFITSIEYRQRLGP